MNRLLKTFLIICLFTSTNLLFAQEKEQIKTYVQFSGKVVQLDGGEPIHGVRITNLSRGTLAFSNDKGVFTIVVAPNDRIQMSHIGMDHQFFNIPSLTDSKIYREFALDINPEEIKAVLIAGLPSLDELGDRMMALNVDEDPARALALDNPDVFNILDTIVAHEPSLLAFKNGKVESSPISWFYERVYKKIKEKLPKPNRKEILPTFKKSGEPEISN